MTECIHPEDQLQPEMLNADDPDLRYCKACRCVIKRVDGSWVPDSVPGQITKAKIGRKTYRYG